MIISIRTGGVLISRRLEYQLQLALPKESTRPTRYGTGRGSDRVISSRFTRLLPKRFRTSLVNRRTIWIYWAKPLQLGSFLPNKSPTKVGTLNTSYQSRTRPFELSGSAQAPLEKAEGRQVNETSEEETRQQRLSPGAPRLLVLRPRYPGPASRAIACRRPALPAET
jgi:hypothetical protein